MPLLEIELRGPLLVAGTRSPALGIDAATVRRYQDGRWVPVVPASALRGAVRLQLEALLAGAGREVASPYPFDGAGDEAVGEGARPDAVAAGPDDPVARLFGYSDSRRARSGGGDGCLRFGDAVPIDAERAAAAFAVRPGVEIHDLTGAAADRKLFFREVADGCGGELSFVARLDIERDARPEDVELLRRAVVTTHAVGAAKASGGGSVRIQWRDAADGDGRGVEVAGRADSARRARLTLTALEPLHLGDGGPIGNYHGTRSYLPGATVRGAVAWALLRAGRVRPEEELFQHAFVDQERALSFGDGLPIAGAEEEPKVVPVTRRRCKETGEILDVLASELARERVHRALAVRSEAVRLRGEAGERKLEALPARPAAGLLHRVRTRVSIDRVTGAAAPGKLFSIEQVEPWSAAPAGGCAATFVCAIEGLEPSTAELLARLEGIDLIVGGRSRQGLGRVAAKLELEPAEPVEASSGEAAASVDGLATEVDRLAAAYARRVGLSAEAAEGSVGERKLVPVALVASADFVGGSGEDHPLASTTPAGPEPIRSFLVAATAGGYDQRPREARRSGGAGPLKPLETVVGAGSVFVYEVPRDGLEEWLAELLPSLRQGVGGRREGGCGRFAVFEWPIRQRVATREEPMPGTIGLAIGLKNELVERATKVAKKAGKHQQAASQLRNLLQISQTESEVAVLANFIQYQAARTATKGFWGPIHEDVIRDLEWIAGQATDVAHRSLANQHYFGYLVRAYVYEKLRGRQGGPGAQGRQGRGHQGGQAHRPGRQGGAR